MPPDSRTKSCSCLPFSSEPASLAISTISIMSDTDKYPCILLAFVIFLSYRRGGGFIEIDLDITDTTQHHTRRIQYCLDRNSTVQNNLKRCSAFLDTGRDIPVQGSYPAHAALCICQATNVSTPRTSYLAAIANSPNMVHFSSPTSDPQTAARDIRAWEHIHQQIVTQDARTPLSHIELVKPRDDPALHRLSSVPLPRPQADDFPSLFQRVVQEHSEDNAIESWDKHLTYSELESASTIIAVTLHRLGVKRGDIVIVALKWSSWAPVCALAIFKAAAAFCFIDPDESIERVDWFLNAVKGRFVLCDAASLGRLSTSSAQVISVQSLSLDNAEPSLQPQHQEIFAKDIAFVLFTSGSTGPPKTVLTSQQALSAGAEHQARALGINEHSRVLGEGPLFFAGVLPKLLFSLAVGACLCIPKHSQSIVEAANELRTNFMSIFVGAADRIDPLHLKTRHTVCIGAEAVPSSTAMLWGRHHSLRIAYGASEMNGVVWGGPWDDEKSPRNVGRSAAHRVWIVDPCNHDRLMPLGWPGEVLVQSVALASGYLDNEIASARAFPRTPAWYHAAAKPRVPTTSTLEETGELPVRWYKTGDMGYVNPTTLSLEVLGRIDQLQLALPGGRVDVTALEEAAQEAVGRPLGIAVQLGVPLGESVPRLFAFLASRHDSGQVPRVRVSASGVVQDASLRRALLAAWPRDTCIGPEYVVMVEGLPRVHTGKIWRHLLREWISTHTAEQLMPWQLIDGRTGRL